MAQADTSYGVSNEALEALKRLEKLSITSSHLVHLPEKLLCSLSNLQVCPFFLVRPSFISKTPKNLLTATASMSRPLYEQCTINT